MARWLLLILLCCGVLPAQARVALAPGETARAVAGEIRFLRDDGGRLTRDEVLARPAADWQRNRDEVFSHGYNSAAWWLRFEIGNDSAQPVLRLLELAYPVLDEVELWVLDGDALKAHYEVGDKQPFTARPIHHRYFLFPLNLPPEATQTVLLRVRSTSSVQAPLTLWEAGAYFEHDQGRIISQGIYFGAMGLMAIYSFFVFMALRERVYLYYVVYVVSMPLFLAGLNGFAFQYLWPEGTQWNDRALIISLALTVLAGSLFTDQLLHIRERLPRFRPVIGGLLLASSLIAVAAFFVGYALLIRVLIVVAVIACVTFLSAGGVRWYRGDVSARFYTIAWSTMLFGGIVMALNKFQLLPQNFWTENATQTGSAFTLILLSFAMLARINEERRLRFQAEQEARLSERRVFMAQTQALEAQREANEQLELRVQERTSELQQANAKLEELSATDQLTGIRNRRYLDKVLEEEFRRSQRYRRSLAVLLLDIDHFKRFNDVWGHQVGDECLRQVAQVILREVRSPIDHAARYGGEEFCVVMPETTAEGAQTLGERIRAAVEAMDFHVRGERVPVTMSVGVAAMIPPEVADVEALLRAADMALYDAKGEGRNRVVVSA